MNAPSPWFTPAQRRIVAAGVTALAVVALVGALLLLLRSVGLALRSIRHVLAPPIVAMVVALVFQPYYGWLKRHLRHSAPLAVLAFFVTALVPMAALLTLLLTMLYAQAVDLIGHLPQLWTSAIEFFETRRGSLGAWAEGLGLDTDPAALLARHKETLTQWAAALGDAALSAGAGVAGYLSAVVNWFVMPIYLAFFLTAPPAGGRVFERLLPFISDRPRRLIGRLADEFMNILASFFRGQMLIAGIQALLFAAGFALVGLRAGLLIGLCLGLMNIIPYLGNVVGLAIALPVALFQENGGWGRVALTLAVFAAVQSLEGYVLTPRIMGRRTGLHPVLVIFSFFFWGALLDGLLGVLLAIPLSAFFTSVWRIVRETLDEALPAAPRSGIGDGAGRADGPA
jgi:predicted PurR-regulated permease PerM